MRLRSFRNLWQSYNLSAIMGQSSNSKAIQPSFATSETNHIFHSISIVLEHNPIVGIAAILTADTTRSTPPNRQPPNA